MANRPADDASGSRGAPLGFLRAALAGDAAWIVGGAVRDGLRGGSAPTDLDIVVAADVERAARRVAAGGDAHAFPLSSQFGAWRVVARNGSWHADLNPLRGGTIESDLALRDFTVNAIAEPLAGGELIDPLGGRVDLAAGTLRLARHDSLEADPLRALRLVRLACELGLTPDELTARAARRVSSRLADIAAERIYAELQRIIGSERAVSGVRMLVGLQLSRAVLPELDALQGVIQSRFHHLDVYEHTLAVLAETVALDTDPGSIVGSEHAEEIRSLLAEPLGDEVSRGVGLRFGALLHDIAKPATRAELDDGRIGFPDHDELGARSAREILRRLRASERMQAHVAALVRHHLRLGFLVDRAPISRDELFSYLSACGPVTADVTLLSAADRLATRGARSEEMIEAHLELVRQVLGEALCWHRDGPPRAPLRGDELAAALGIPEGPLVGRLLACVSRACFNGEISTRAQAIAYARRQL